MSISSEQRQRLLKDFGWDDSPDFGWNEAYKYNNDTQRVMKMNENLTITSTENILKLMDLPNDCEGKTPGFIIIHQNVGSLPPANAEMFCERVKDKFINSKEWLEFKKKFPNWNFVLLPSRTEESYVEVFHEEDGQRKEVIGVIASIINDEEPPLPDTPELKKKVIDYILMMCGAPVLKLEFTEDQLDFCYIHTLNQVHDYHRRVKKFTFTESYRAQSVAFLCAGALAHAKVILGRIRQHQYIPDDSLFLHPDDLYNEGKLELTAWKNQLSHQEEKSEDEDA